MKKPFQEALKELVESQAANDNVVRLLAYFGGAESALAQTTVEELSLVHGVLTRFDSVFAPFIAGLISRRTS